MQDFSKLIRNANDDLTKDGESFKYLSSSRNRFGNKQKVWIFCDAAKNIDFDIKPETWIDKLFKWLKISHEMQLGDKQLDSLIYFATDDSEVFNTIRNNPEIQIEILEIIKICKDSKIKLDLLSLHKGQIGIVLRQKRYSSVNEAADKLVPLLRKISNQFDEKMRNPIRSEDPVFTKVQRILKPIAYNFLFLIFASLPLVLFDDSKQLTSVKPLIKDAVLTGSFLTALVMIFTIFYLAGSSRVHLTLKAVAMAGIVSFSIDSLVILRNINIYFDNSKSHFINTKIYEKYQGKRRGGVKKLYSKNEEYDSDIFVTDEVWERAEINDDLCIEEKSGLLGYKWINKYHLGICSSTKF